MIEEPVTSSPGIDAEVAPKAVSGTSATARICCVCSRAFTGRAGRMVDCRPACRACGSRLRPKVGCPGCGRPTARLRRRPGAEALTCEGCTRRGTHATCARCGRHRRVAARDADGDPLCPGCASDAPATRACPDCGGAVPGRGAAPCHACGLRRLIGRRLADGAGLVAPGWARALYGEFCAWDALPRDRHAIARQAEAYARCFAAIGAGCAGPEEVTQARLLALLGNEGLRRMVLVVRFLAARLKLDWSPAAASDAAEARRIEALLAAHAERTWAADLAAYREHLKGCSIRPVTVRTYLTAAAGLFTSAGVDGAADLTAVSLTAHLRRTPGHREHLPRFTAWLPGVGGPALSVHRKRKSNLRRRERELLREARRLVEALDTEQDIRRGRALLATALARVYHLPLPWVLALARAEVVEDDGDIVLWPEGLELRLTRDLAIAFRKFAAAGGMLVFPGRNRVQPLSTVAVRHHVPSLRQRTAGSRLERL